MQPRGHGWAEVDMGNWGDRFGPIPTVQNCGTAHDYQCGRPRQECSKDQELLCLDGQPWMSRQVCSVSTFVWILWECVHIQIKVKRPVRIWQGFCQIPKIYEFIFAPDHAKLPLETWGVFFFWRICFLLICQSCNYNWLVGWVS